LSNPDGEARGKAVYALGAMGPQAGEAVPDLARILSEDPDGNMRNQAALALSKMAPASVKALPELTKALEDKELMVRMNAVMALRRLKAEARPAVPALIKAATDDAHLTNMRTFHFTIQEMAVLALGSASTGTADGVPTLKAALEKGPTDDAKLAAMRALGDVGPEARSTAPLVRTFLDHKMKELRESAAETLESMGEPAKAPEGQGGSEVAPDEFELPEADRVELWEIEHHGNVLVKYGFGPLADALKAADASALTRLTAEDFTGTDLGDPQRFP
jgi:HEAT repeat protein